MMAIDINMQDLLDILNEGRAHVKVEMSAEDLKAFSEELGVESYGAVADALVAWYKLQKAALTEA